MAQAGQMMAMAGQSGTAGTRPTTRNALMTMLLPFGCVFGGIIISIIFGILASVTGVGLIGTLGGLLYLVAMLAGAYFGIMAMMKMVYAEIKSVTGRS